MAKQRDNLNKKTGLFFYLFLFTLLLCIWQQAFLVYTKDSYFVLDAVMAKLFIVPVRVYATIVLYGCLQFAFYALFSFLIGTLAYFSAAQLKLSTNRTFKWGVFLWITGVIAIYFVNALCYPLSAFSDLVDMFIPVFLTKILLVLVLLPLLASMILALLRIFYLLRQHRNVKWIAFFGVTLLVGLTAFYVGHRSHSLISTTKVSHRQPNIFIIGLDAVRPERLGFNGYKNDTETVDQFLKNSTVFMDSLTPIARTYPAWASIMTGLFPKHNGIRFTLTDTRGLKITQKSMGTWLKKQGYQTVFATDGSRFNDMGSVFGIEKEIGPEPGVNNFIMDLVDGTPLLNLLINTEVGKLLYPNVIGNRDVVFTYDPEKFIEILKEQLPPASDKPLFAGIHLNLTHAPFEWASSPPHANLSNSVLYDKSLERIDLQFRSLMTFLKDHHYLDNAVVILMSDHGEAFGITGDRLITEPKYIRGEKSHPDIFKRLNALQPTNKRIDVSAGHGTDVLSLTQYRNLLAIRLYGFKQNAKRRVFDLASLIDIQPTIMDLLHVSTPKTDGISLVPYLEGKTVQRAEPRKFFIEIDFTPVAIRASDVSMQNVIFQSIDLFEIVPGTSTIVMKPSMFKRILRTKQKAMYYGDWLLGLYPDRKDRLYPVLVNWKTGYWTDDLSSTFAENSPAKTMMQDLIRFYGHEVTGYWRPNT